MIFDIEIDFESWHFWHLPIKQILKIQYFPLGMLIFMQKSFQFCTPRLKDPQPVLP